MSATPLENTDGWGRGTLELHRKYYCDAGRMGTAHAGSHCFISLFSVSQNDKGFKFSAEETLGEDRDSSFSHGFHSKAAP